MTVPTLKSRRGCSPMALMGCGCGLVSAIGILLIFILLGVQLIHEARDPAWSRADYEQCRQNLSYLRGSLASYYDDHQRYPARLDELDPRYIDYPTRLRCPLEVKGIGAARYRYTPAAAKPTDPLVTCTNHGQGTFYLQRNGRIHLPAVFPRGRTRE